MDGSGLLYRTNFNALIYTRLLLFPMLKSTYISERLSAEGLNLREVV